MRGYSLVVGRWCSTNQGTTVIRYIQEILSVEVNSDGENMQALVVLHDPKTGETTQETIPGEYCVFECEDDEADRYGFAHDGWACDAFFYNQCATVGDLQKLSRMVWDKYYTVGLV